MIKFYKRISILKVINRIMIECRVIFWRLYLVKPLKFFLRRMECPKNIIIPSIKCNFCTPIDSFISLCIVMIKKSYLYVTWYEVKLISRGYATANTKNFVPCFFSFLLRKKCIVDDFFKFFQYHKQNSLPLYAGVKITNEVYLLLI